MDEKRKGEIALALLKYRTRHEGIQLKPDIWRELGNVATKTGIPLIELREFMKDLIEELVKEAFGD